MLPRPGGGWTRSPRVPVHCRHRLHVAAWLAYLVLGVVIFFRSGDPKVFDHYAKLGVSFPRFAFGRRGREVAPSTMPSDADTTDPAA